METAELARLRYRCRRGMLELDALLDRFTHSPEFALLTAPQGKVLEQLLNESDPQLLRWFMQSERCEDPALSQLIAMILRA